MRIVSAFLLLAVLGVTSVAHADGIGCGGDDTTLGNPPNDLSVPRDDLRMPVPDLSTPRDLTAPRDARRDHRRRRRAGGAGLMLLSGLGLVGVALTRRTVRS